MLFCADHHHCHHDSMIRVTVVMRACSDIPALCEGYISYVTSLPEPNQGWISEASVRLAMARK